MSDSMTAPRRDPETRPAPARRTELNRRVADRARILQRLSNADVPQAVRTLAMLRRAAGSPPGSEPTVWADTIGLVPDQDVGRTDDPSSAELAAHHAMTLFALHRQGRSEVAHSDGVAPGTAFARLAFSRGGPDGESEGVRRRFDAMITATSSTESAHHLRGLVVLARSAGVALDYGILAEDLADLWSTRGRNRARLRWARQYRGGASATPGAPGPHAEPPKTHATEEESS